MLIRFNHNGQLHEVSEAFGKKLVEAERAVEVKPEDVQPGAEIISNK